ncbi:hypothetical protein BH10ACI3_BH10ACI3_16950 [soil metagenome]
MREEKVTYTLEMEGKFHIIENVPARVSEETGEKFFSPETNILFRQIHPFQQILVARVVAERFIREVISDSV